jgi:hypothetical protein
MQATQQQGVIAASPGLWCAVQAAGGCVAVGWLLQPLLHTAHAKMMRWNAAGRGYSTPSVAPATPKPSLEQIPHCAQDTA